MQSAAQIPSSPAGNSNIFANQHSSQQEIPWAGHKVCVKPLSDKLIQYDQQTHEGRRLFVRMVGTLNAYHDACFVLPRTLVKPYMPKQILTRVAEPDPSSRISHFKITEMVLNPLSVEERLKVLKEFKGNIDMGMESLSSQLMLNKLLTHNLNDQILAVMDMLGSHSISVAHFVNAATRLGLLTEQEISGLYSLLLSDCKNQSLDVECFDGGAPDEHLTDLTGSLVAEFLNVCQSVKSEYVTVSNRQIQEIVMALLLSELESNTDLDLRVLTVGPQETFSRLENPKIVSDECWDAWKMKYYRKVDLGKICFFIKKDIQSHTVLNRSIKILARYLTPDSIYALVHGEKGRDIIGGNVPFFLFDEGNDSHALLRKIFDVTKTTGEPLTELIKAAIKRGFLPQECIGSILNADQVDL